MKPTISKTLEENESSEILIPDENLGKKDNQTKLSGKDTKKSESPRPFLDKFYLLAGVGAAILILIIYSRRK